MSLSINLKITLGALFANFLLWLGLGVALKPAPYPLIIHYQSYLGPDILGRWFEIFSLPLAGFLIIILNTFFIWLVNKKEARLVLAATACLAQIFLILGSVNLLLVNG